MLIEIDLHDQIPTELKEASLYIESLLTKNGFEAYLVGGSVRDLLLKKNISDIDFTTNATPQEMIKIFPKVVPVGIEFGTIIVLYKKLPIEVTTYRTDQDYEDGRRPSKIIFGQSLEEDVYRRDFTMNGMAYHFSNKILIDYVNGMEDIKNKIIRTIGKPLDRFNEDGLRPIRGCRFAAKLNFTIEEQTQLAISKVTEVIKKVSPERFYDEWKKTLTISSKQYFWQLLQETHILSIFLDNFLFYKDSNIFKQYLDYIQKTETFNMSCYLGIILLFENKIKLFNEDEYIIFIKGLIKKLKFSSNEVEECIHYLYSPFFKIKNLNHISFYKYKKALSQIKENEIENHKKFVFNILEYENQITSKDKILLICQSYEDIIKKEKHPIYLKDLAINGQDVLAINLEREDIGKCLKLFHKIILRFPKLNNKDNLKKLLLQYNN